jgi:tripartite-type tricarboxylate transporter receptor subunit TctC
VATAPPDGHTLLAGAPGILAVNPWVMKALPYDPERDFAGISMIANIPYVMAIPPSVPARSVAEFIVLVKRNPGRYNLATSGTSSRLTVEMIRAMAGGLDMTMVQYRGGAPARIDLLRGDVQLVIDQMPSFLEDFRKGELVPLAVGTRTRSALLPDVPTMMEAGLPDYEAWAWLAYAAPSQTPRAVINRLSEEIGRVLRKPEVLARLASWGSEPVGGSPEEMDRMVSAERSRWGEVVRLAGIEKGLRSKVCRRPQIAWIAGGSGSNLEQLGEEDGLGPHVAPVDYPKLPLPHHRHHLVARQCSSCRMETAKAEPRSDQAFTRRWSCSTMVLTNLHCRRREKRHSSPSSFRCSTAHG